MLKKLIANLKHNFQIFAIGATFSAMGLLLWTDHKYFFWPPQYAGIMNDDGLDAIAVAVGVGLMYYALKNEKMHTEVLMTNAKQKYTFITTNTRNSAEMM